MKSPVGRRQPCTPQSSEDLVYSQSIIPAWSPRTSKYSLIEDLSFTVHMHLSWSISRQPQGIGSLNTQAQPQNVATVRIASVADVTSLTQENVREMPSVASREAD
jgi:hypothetical protein